MWGPTGRLNYLYDAFYKSTNADSIRPCRCRWDPIKNISGKGDRLVEIISQHALLSSLFVNHFTVLIIITTTASSYSRRLKVLGRVNRELL